MRPLYAIIPKIMRPIKNIPKFLSFKFQVSSLFMLYKKLLESNLTDLQVANLKLIEAGQSHKF